MPRFRLACPRAMHTSSYFTINRLAAAPKARLPAPCTHQSHFTINRLAAAPKARLFFDGKARLRRSR